MVHLGKISGKQRIGALFEQIRKLRRGSTRGSMISAAIAPLI
jgi:hypothetical protein